MPFSENLAALISFKVPLALLVASTRLYHCSGDSECLLEKSSESRYMTMPSSSC